MQEDLESLAEKLALEHAEVRRRSREIERAAAGGARGVELADLLDGFLEHLRRHFALEQEGDVFDGVPHHDERTRAIVESLLEEHAGFLQRTEVLRDRARTFGGGPVGNDVREDVETLLSDLRRHEIAENDVFQRLVYRESGVKD